MTGVVAERTLMDAARERVLPLLDQPPRFGPHTYPCACGAARHEHTGKSLSGPCLRTGCKRYRRDPVDALAEQVLAAYERGLVDDLRAADDEHTAQRAKRNTVGTVRVSASDSSSCRRAIQYREAPPDDLFLSPTDKRAAFIGTLIHDGAMRVRKALYSWRQFERTVHIEGLGDSQFDQFDPIIGEVDDLKTAGSWKWDLVTDYGPPASEWRQVLIYGLALLHEGYPIRTVRLTYINREKGRDQTFQEPFDQAKAEEAVAYLTTIATQIELGIEQPRDEPGPSLSPICRSYCEFRDYCWNIPQAERAGRTPESWTLLGPEPADPEVEAALAEYIEARDQESASKDRKEAAKALIGGLRPDRYGDLKFTVKEQLYPDQKGYLERVRRWAESDPAKRGPFEDIEVPRTPRMVTRIGRVAKAVLEKERKAREKVAKAVAEAIMEGTA